MKLSWDESLNVFPATGSAFKQVFCRCQLILKLNMMENTLQFTLKLLEKFRQIQLMAVTIGVQHVKII